MRTTHRVVLVLALATLAVLAACSRGLQAGNNSTPTTTTFSSSTPIVVSTSPANGVGTDRQIYVQFSHEMDASTINTDTFHITGVSSTVNYDATNRIAYLKPAASLAAQTQYTATVTTGVRDTSGVALPSAFSFAFNTRATTDTSPPGVLTVDPIAGCVAVNGPVSVVFDENMNSSTINTSTFLVAGFTGTVTYNPLNKIASFTPSTPFTAGATMQGEITTGAQDLGGVSLAADFLFPFNVCPATPPPPPGQLSFCSFTKGGFQGGGTPGQMFNNLFPTVFASDLIIGVFDGSGPQSSDRWTAAAPGPTALQTFLISPAVGASGPLTTDLVNPTASSDGDISTQVAALTLNVGFSGVTGGTPAGFGNLILTGTGTSLDGSSISTILGMANLALAGDGLPAGYTFDSLNTLITNLNESFDGCTESTWATAHLTSK